MQGFGDLGLIFDHGVIYGLLKNALDQWFILSLPIALIAMLGAIVGNVSQFGW